MKTITTLSSLMANIAIFGVAALLYLSESFTYSAILTLAAMISMASWIRTVRMTGFQVNEWKRSFEMLFRIFAHGKRKLLAAWNQP